MTKNNLFLQLQFAKVTRDKMITNLGKNFKITIGIEIMVMELDNI